MSMIACVTANHGEGEAPAEPKRRERLGGSLALPVSPTRKSFRRSINMRMSIQFGLAFCVAMLGLQAESQLVAPTRQPAASFLKAAGTQLLLGGRPFHNVGANMPDLFERFLQGDDVAAKESLARAHAAGIRFVRCFGSTWGPKEFGTFETDRPRWLAAYDRMLAAADREGISVVPSLLFNPNMIPGYVRTKTGKDEQIVDYLTKGSASNRLAVEYLTTIVSRYKDDPRVIFWEIGNEYNLEADLSARWKNRPANQIPTSDNIRAFLVQIATLIKKIDPNHLVTSGNADMRPYAWHIRQAMLAHSGSPDPCDYPMDWGKDTFGQYAEMLRFFNPPPLDIVSVHQYPIGNEAPPWVKQDDTRAAMLCWTREACERMGKPLFVGEFAETMYKEGREQPSLWVHDFLGQMRAGLASISAVWTWEYGSDDPGQEKYSLRADRTPEIIRAIQITNRALAGLSSQTQRPEKFDRDSSTSMMTCSAEAAPAVFQQPVSPLQVLRPPKAHEVSYVSSTEVKARNEYEREHLILFPKLVRGNPRMKTLAITFDDGPHPDFTPRLLEILKRYDVKATFFVIGTMVDQHPELIRDEVALGHEVANHTYHHLRLPFLSDRDIERELDLGNQAINRAIGSPVRLFRPPGGEYDADVIDVARRNGYVMVLWTDDPADFANPGSKVIETRVLKQIGNGGILLLHDGSQQTVDILPDLLQKLKSKGYQFVTCSEMAAERGVITTGGPRVPLVKP